MKHCDLETDGGYPIHYYHVTQVTIEILMAANSMVYLYVASRRTFKTEMTCNNVYPDGSRTLYAIR